MGIFNNTTFAKLFFASVTSRLGTIVGMTAFTFYLLDRFSEQPAYATFAEMMYSAPTLLVFVVTGVFADTLDRQKIAYYSDVICGILSLCLLGALWIDVMPVIFLVLFIRSAVAKFFTPAEMSLVQGILTKKEYPTAAGLNQMVAGVFNLFATGLGLGAYWLLGIQGAIVFDLITFIVSALLIRSSVITEEVRMPNGARTIKDLRYTSILQDFLRGLQYIIQHKLLLTIVSGFFVIGIVNGGLTVMPLYMLKYHLTPEAYEQWTVVLGIVFGVGMIAGSIAGALLTKIWKLYTCLSFSLIMAGSFIIVSGASSNVVFFLSLSGLIAFSIPLANIAIGGWLPSIVDKRMMGRVESWITPIMMVSHTATLAIITVGFPSIISIQSLFYVCGAILLLVGVFYMILLPRLSSKFEKHQQDIVVNTDVQSNSIEPVQ
ncbi:MFS transporter [Pontibacillus salicampi]|uniref:MFS transporter n=1 Tax=Pontibacillus salicampi TaxID=1449801 RepID=A0ABV6LIF5_9BACI